MTALSITENMRVTDKTINILAGKEIGHQVTPGLLNSRLQVIEQVGRQFANKSHTKLSQVYPHSELQSMLLTNILASEEIGHQVIPGLIFFEVQVNN